MYYVSSYNRITEKYGVTDTEDDVEEFYSLFQLCDMTYKKGIKIMGVRKAATDVRLIGREYFELRDELHRKTIGGVLAGVFKSDEFIDVTDIVNEFVRFKGYDYYPYLFHDNTRVKIRDNRVYWVDPIKRYDLDLPFNGKREYVFDGRYMYNFSSRDLFFGVKGVNGYIYWFSAINCIK